MTTATAPKKERKKGRKVIQEEPAVSQESASQEIKEEIPPQRENDKRHKSSKLPGYVILQQAIERVREAQINFLTHRSDEAHKSYRAAVHNLVAQAGARVKEFIPADHAKKILIDFAMTCCSIDWAEWHSACIEFAINQVQDLKDGMNILKQTLSELNWTLNRKFNMERGEHYEITAQSNISEKEIEIFPGLSAKGIVFRFRVPEGASPEEVRNLLTKDSNFAKLPKDIQKKALEDIPDFRKKRTCDCPFCQMRRRLLSEDNEDSGSFESFIEMLLGLQDLEITEITFGGR